MFGFLGLNTPLNSQPFTRPHPCCPPHRYHLITLRSLAGLALIALKGMSTCSRSQLSNRKPTWFKRLVELSLRYMCKLWKEIPYVSPVHNHSHHIKLKDIKRGNHSAALNMPSQTQSNKGIRTVRIDPNYMITLSHRQWLNGLVKNLTDMTLLVKHLTDMTLLALH